MNIEDLLHADAAAWNLRNRNVGDLDAAIGRAISRRAKRSRLLMPAVAAATVAALACLSVWIVDGGGNTSRGSAAGSSPCQGALVVDGVSQLQMLPPTLGMSLSFSGRSACSLLSAPPLVTVLKSDGSQLGQTTGGTESGKTYPQFTVRQGDRVAFGITRFLACQGVPPDDYKLHVVLVDGSNAPGPSVDIRVKISGSASAIPNCGDSRAIGVVSVLRAIP